MICGLATPRGDSLSNGNCSGKRRSTGQRSAAKKPRGGSAGCVFLRFSHPIATTMGKKKAPASGQTPASLCSA